MTGSMIAALEQTSRREMSLCDPTTAITPEDACLHKLALFFHTSTTAVIGSAAMLPSQRQRTRNPNGFKKHIGQHRPTSTVQLMATCLVTSHVRMKKMTHTSPPHSSLAWCKSEAGRPETSRTWRLRVQTCGVMLGKHEGFMWPYNHGIGALHQAIPMAQLHVRAK